MNDLAINTLASNITTSTATNDIQSITDRFIYYPNTVSYDPCNYIITTSAWPTKLETDSNELKINIKKVQIKFNFSL